MRSLGRGVCVSACAYVCVCSAAWWRYSECVASGSCNGRLAHLFFLASFSASNRSRPFSASLRFCRRFSAGLTLPEGDETGAGGAAGATEVEGDAESLAFTEDSKEPLGLMSLGRGVCVSWWESGCRLRRS